MLSHVNIIDMAMITCVGRLCCSLQERAPHDSSDSLRLQAAVLATRTDLG